MIEIESIEKILKIVCGYYNIDFIKGKTILSKREYVMCRYIAMNICKELVKMNILTKKATSKEIGWRISKQSAVIVNHAKKTINNLIYTDKKFKDEYDNIFMLVRSNLEDLDILGTIRTLKKQIKTLENKVKFLNNETQ